MKNIFQLRQTVILTAVSSFFLFILPMKISAETTVIAKKALVPSHEHIEIDKYLGVWYEIARKPATFQNKCKKDVTAIYTYNENGNLSIKNSCVDRFGKVKQVTAEAFIENSPFNSKYKISFLPESIRWIPMVRGDYWILKIDSNYQMVLVGEPERNNLWLLSRNPHPDQTEVNQFLEYAKDEGYNLKDLIHTIQTEQPKS